MRDIPAIIEAAGGTKDIAKALGGKISADAVRKWPKFGIPERHWRTIRRLSAATNDELHALNEKARRALGAAA